MEGLYVAMLGGKIELGWLVPNKMLYLISLWETFDVWAIAVCEIYLRRSVLLQQKKKKEGQRGPPILSRLHIQESDHFNWFLITQQLLTMGWLVHV